MNKKKIDAIRMLTLPMLFIIVITFTGCGKKDVTFSSTAISGDTKSEEENITGNEEEQTGSKAAQELDESDNQEISEVQVVVYICGAVNQPGVYEFSEGSRVCDALKAAGGVTKSADAEYLNQARLLVDGEQITVLTKKQTKELEQGQSAGANDSSSSVTSSDNSQGTDSSLVNINSASKEELMTLSGIGESKAESILSYREKNGPFQAIEDIMNITGIKEGVYSKIEDSICVN